MHRLSTRVRDALVLLWIVTTLTFVLIHLAPGDPASLLVSPTATAEEVTRQRAVFGLDAPLPVQYVRWLRGVLGGDLGISLASARPVTTVIAEALPVSLFLGAASVLLSFTLGVLLGGFQALRAGRRADTAITVVTTGLYAAPSFWLALALVALATTGASAIGAPAWARLPAFGMQEPAALATGFDRWRDLARHAILPLLVLSIPGAAGVARYARASLMGAAGAPHVQAAAARGLARGRLERRYILRNAWTPIVVLLGLTLPGIIAGSVFVEQVFAWPGLGRTMLSAIASRDYPVVLGLTLVYATVVIVSNLLADSAVAALDPRRSAA
ncbi:MAG TPA: ABC transporter permease [Gemmatimonas sp.]|nr:ABC transporter permease [Gemmatimonas sp.]